MPAAQRIGASGVKFYCRVTFGQGRARRVCVLISVAPKIVHIVVLEWVEIRIGPNALIHFAAQKRPDWAVTILAKNIPTGNFQPRKSPHDR